jgi:formylglycine-generating enzyme required for sulfatase activity
VASDVQNKGEMDIFIICGALLTTILILSGCDRTPEGMVLVPEGKFIMGSEEVDTEGLAREFGMPVRNLYEDERPMRKMHLEGFYIDKYEVTNTQYKEFVEATGYHPPFKWKGRNFPEGKGEHPVINVTWFDANNYCTWADKRLPTEAEWEKAARGPYGNKYPWGGEYDEKKGNLNTGGTAPVGSYKSDKSYYGVYDMGGNVMEWVYGWYEPYPGNKLTNKEFGKGNRVLRGGIGGLPGHYIMNSIYARTSYRHNIFPSAFGDDGGLRCAKSIEDK